MCRRLSVSVHHPNNFPDLDLLVVFTLVIEKGKDEHLVAEKVNFAVYSD